MAGPQQKAVIVNVDSDGTELIAYPALNGSEANVATTDTTAEITVPTGSKSVFVSANTTDCILLGGTSPITIGAGEGFLLTKGVIMVFGIDSSIDSIAHIRNGDANGVLSYSFA